MHLLAFSWFLMYNRDNENEDEQENTMDRSSKIELTNMCLIYDESRVLVQEKQGLKDKYKGGLVFPGGHVEPDESLLDSVIREMKEIGRASCRERV